MSASPAFGGNGSAEGEPVVRTVDPNAFRLAGETAGLLSAGPFPTPQPPPQMRVMLPTISITPSNSSGVWASTPCRDTPVSLYVYHRDLVTAYYQTPERRAAIVEEARQRSVNVTAELEQLGVYYPCVYAQHMETISGVRGWMERLEALYGQNGFACSEPAISTEGRNVCFVWLYHKGVPTFEVMIGDRPIMNVGSLEEAERCIANA